MAKVNEYRKSRGIEPLSDPTTAKYYHADVAGAGEYLSARGLAVAQKICVNGLYEYEYETVAGWYGETCTSSADAEFIAEKFFNDWLTWTKTSGMLQEDVGDMGLQIGTVTVVEYYNEYGYYQYSAVLKTEAVTVTEWEEFPY